MDRLRDHGGSFTPLATIPASIETVLVRDSSVPCAELDSDAPLVRLGEYRFQPARTTAELDQVHRLNYATFVREVAQHADSGTGRLVDKFLTLDLDPPPECLRQKISRWEKLLKTVSRADRGAPLSLLPGPVQISAPVLAAWREAPVSRRSDQFVARYQRVRERLDGLVHGPPGVALFCGSGTLVNDVVAATLAADRDSRPGLVLVNGEFGARLAKAGRRFGLKFPTPDACAARYAAYAGLGRFVRSSLRALGVEPVASSESAAPVVTSFAPPPGWSPDEFAAACRLLGYDVAHASRYLRRRGWVQIATMGALAKDDLRPLFDGLARRLARPERTAAPASGDVNRWS